ncbi:MAG TPA: LysR family transcriptional regulator [Polyangiaceae bacterium]|nr:LysR family transcriptional regulator [Polyangiaceae bacterium]
MELRHLQAFVVLAEELHFGRAARRLHLVQSAVTRAIQALEADVGVTLFERGRRGVRLTAAGKAFEGRARDVLAAVEASAVEARRAAQGEMGRLRVVWSEVAAVSALTDAFRRFRQRYPAVEVSAGLLGTRDHAEALHGDRCDLAFSSAPLLDDGLEAEPVIDDELWAIVQAQHPFAKRRSISLQDLNQDTNILLPRWAEPVLHARIERSQAALGLTPPPLLESHDFTATLALVAAGFGVAQAPGAARRFSYEGVVFVVVRPRVPIHLFAVRARQRRAPTAERFLDLLRAATTRPKKR